MELPKVEEQPPAAAAAPVASAAPSAARPRKRKQQETGLNGGYWGTAAAEAAASASEDGGEEDAKYTRRRKASAPKLPFRTRSIFDDGSAQTEHKILGRMLTPVHRGPNIYTIDDFLTSGEVDHLLELIAQNKRRFVGSKTDQDDGVGLHDTQYRTSRTSACATPPATPSCAACDAQRPLTPCAAGLASSARKEGLGLGHPARGRPRGGAGWHAVPQRGGPADCLVHGRPEVRGPPRHRADR